MSKLKFYDEGLNQEELKNEYLKANSRCKYKDSEELISKIEEYFFCCNQQHRPYTISGLALFFGIKYRNIKKV